MNNKAGGSLSTCADPRCHIGETHGVFTLVDVLEEKDKYGHYVYKGVCNECGYEKFSHYGDFSGTKSMTTICRHIRKNGSKIPYGHKWSVHRLQGIFSKMVDRCYNKHNRDYRWYGQKGIAICQDWLEDPLTFEEWALNNGYNDNLTIDRIKPDKNYCPENCRWTTVSENSRRAGKVNWITVGDNVLTGRQWAAKLGLGTNIINNYIRKYGINKTTELVKSMIESDPSTKHREVHQTWFDVYGIQV